VTWARLFLGSMPLSNLSPSVCELVSETLVDATRRAGARPGRSMKRLLLGLTLNNQSRALFKSAMILVSVKRVGRRLEWAGAELL